jgi:cobalt-zinc-cadmium efflux system outer membrane protein
VIAHRHAAMLALLALLGSAAPVAAQPPQAAPAGGLDAFFDADRGLSLDDAIQLALAREPALAAARTQVDAARGQRTQAGLRPNPMFSFEQRTEPSGTDALTTASVDWPLDFHRRPGRVAVADAEIAAATMTVAERERQLAGDVRMRYGAVAFALRDLDVLDQALAAAAAQRDVLAARVGEGAAPPLERDLLQVEAQRLAAERRLQLGEVEAAMVALKRVLGLRPADALRIRERLDGPLPEPPASAPATAAVTPRADVEEARARVAVADAAIARAGYEGRPEASLFASYMRMDAGFPQLGVGPSGDLERVRGVFHYVAGGLKVSLPFFDRQQGARAAAEAQRAGARAALDAAALAAEAELAEAAARDRRAAEAVRLYRDEVRALAEKNLSIVRQSYELGRVSLLDVLAEQRRYLEVERAYSQALRAAFEARAAVLTAKGVVR